MRRAGAGLCGLGVVAVLLAGSRAWGQAGPLVLERGGRTVVVEPYGADVVRVTIGTDRAEAMAKPGYGVSGVPDEAGWTRSHEASGAEVYRSGAMAVRVETADLPKEQRPARRESGGRTPGSAPDVLRRVGQLSWRPPVQLTSD